MTNFVKKLPLLTTLGLLFALTHPIHAQKVIVEDWEDEEDTSLLADNSETDDQYCIQRDDSCCYNIFIEADFLFWGASEDGLGCSFGSTQIDQVTSEGIPTTTIQEK